MADVISQPSAFPDISPHTLQAPEDRHLFEGHIPCVVPSPAVDLSVCSVNKTT